jgi:serine/threonine-protein kinase
MVTAAPGGQTPGLTPDSRFPVGIILGERYRILGLLGRGGMGEVYRAHDLKLEQQVALKFLPEAAAGSPSLMERFRGEVRIARQISHRNVCRVYDLGELNGAAFISMEYVDGEDLASLLRRIGRLPGDKALEFARRLCAGLAAAHEKGVLHRDLKPANIMIDGRGQLLIMDFGLAAVADAIAGHDIRSGTPAYMAPEQRDGREVTVRSDIHALGVVLAEMFTGSRPARDGALASTTKDVDPAIERVIQRCVDKNPAKRFASALDVARALPGGDPLAEALAAGETPSPAMVAASHDTGVLSVRAAAASLAVIVAGLAALVFWGSRNFQVNLTPLPYPREVLEQKAREMVASFGYTQAPRDTYSRFDMAGGYLEWAARNLSPAQRRDQLAKGEPPELIFFFVQSPTDLLPDGPASWITSTDPARPPGAVDLWMDPQGRLRSFRAVPTSDDPPAVPAFDWNRVFEAAGLDASRWSPVDPQDIPTVAFDTRAAWTGAYPSAPQIPLRIEAAAWKGRLVSLAILGPWPRGDGTASTPTPPPTLAVALAFIFWAAGVVIALRNLRLGRSDLLGAVRLAVFVLIGGLIAVVNVAHRAAVPSQAANIVAIAFFPRAVLAWILYMAIEPYVRRHWPQALIGWSRALAGRFHDPVVCGHILVGMAVGLVVGNIAVVDRAQGIPLVTNFRSLYANPIGAWAALLTQSPLFALSVFFLFVLLRILLKRTWLAAAAVFVVLTSFFVFGPPGIPLPSALVTFALMLTVAMRWGLLAVAVSMATLGSMYQTPLTADFSVWYASRGLQEIVMIMAVALWCFYHALGGRKLLKTELLDA